MLNRIKKRPQFYLGLLVLLLIVLPVTVYLIRKQATYTSSADKTVVLSLTPSSSSQDPIQVHPGGTFSLDIMADPGQSSMSYVQVEIDYDPSMVQIDNASSFQLDNTAFPQIMEGPVLTPGKFTISLSVGSNPQAVVKTPTRIGTLTFRSIVATGSAQASTQITFGPTTQALATSSNSSPTENVIANTIPANILMTTTFNSPSNICTGTASANTMFIMDTSGSMNDQVGSSGTKLSNTKSAADNYISIVSKNPQSEVGLVNFATTATLDSPISTNYSSVTSKINALTANGNTCTSCGITTANQAIVSGEKTGVKNVVILLTDGIANYVAGEGSVSEATAEQAALTAAKSGYTASGTTFFTIGVGNDVNSAFLQELAAETGGQYYFAPTTDDLNTIYTEISQIVGKGSVNGLVFQDLSGNGIDEPTDPPLQGWIVQLTPSSNTSAPISVATDANGQYAIGSLCDGSYQVSQQPLVGWSQTDPTNPNGYSVAIANGAVQNNLNFGLTYSPQATPTPQPSPTPTSTPTPTPTPIPSPTSVPTPTPSGTPMSLQLTVSLDGIGNAGDNTNPTASSLSNQSPLTPTRTVQAYIYDTTNTLVATADGTINYASESGTFTGIVSTQTSLPQDQYLVDVWTPYHLTAQLSGIQTLVPDQTNIMPPIRLVAGDADNNNALNILDYNLLMDCYSDLAPAISCTPSEQTATDFNDDGQVNQLDYNLFLREISTQPGQ